MRKKVEDAEAKVEDFRAKANLLVGTDKDDAVGAAARRSQRATCRRAGAKIRRRGQGKTDPREAPPASRSNCPIFSNSELIRRLAEKRVTLRAQLAEQSSTLLADDPRIKELRAQIIVSTARYGPRRIPSRVGSKTRPASGARVDLQIASLELLKNQAASTNGQDVQLRALERTRNRSASA